MTYPWATRHRPVNEGCALHRIDIHLNQVSKNSNLWKLSDKTYDAKWQSRMGHSGFSDHATWILWIETCQLAISTSESVLTSLESWDSWWCAIRLMQTAAPFLHLLASKIGWSYRLRISKVTLNADTGTNGLSQGVLAWVAPFRMQICAKSRWSQSRSIARAQLESAIQ